MDPRIAKLASQLVHHSLCIQPGERVLIAMVEAGSAPFAHAISREVIKVGAYPQVQYTSEIMRSDLMRYGSPEQVGWVPELELYGMNWADVYIGLRGAANLYQHWDISSDRKATNQKVQGVVSRARWEQTRWCLMRVPNVHLAHQGKMDEETLTDQFFAACMLDWARLGEEWRRIARLLEEGSELRIVAKETDLKFSVQGRKWVVFDGKANMPDGEIATAPRVETIDGYISFEHPAVLGGQLVEQPHLRWERGKLVAARSSTQQDFFRQILHTDAGASLIGEFGFGLNSELHHFTNDILIDEKIGGTLHIALGRAYPQCGGDNQSAIHWDIIKDTRQEGQVWLDGRIIFDGGRLCL